ncbi:efflux RND transporter periplasmic adaptor subunit [Paenibacillus athensensis]|uniref:Uncharacterized protein n=1 Tax=Paenibacillus athensensis TaxID=1967502 RepID=A0A4Y8PWB0_9BACL|nr:efflux RND transporter periplasmic adaptor subunit [Paenibacillus athensensis]MCD1258779.1 efflux RND transporter periplasmic adaptor subunit [Paenibacillus athensensis]
MKKAIWIVLIFTAVAVLVGVNVRQLNKAVTITLVKVGKGTLDETVYANGKLAPFEEAVHFAAAAGQIDSIAVVPGDSVEKGDVLLKLDARDVSEQIAAEQLNVRMNALAAEEARRSTFDQVKAAESDTAREELLQRQETSLDKLDLQTEGAQLKIRELQRKLGDYRLTAAISGIVTGLDVKPGQWVNPGQQALTVMNVRKLKVKSYLNELDAGKVTKGQAVTITGDAFAGEYPGMVEFVSPVAGPADSGSRDPMVEMEISLDNPAERLRPGYQVSVALTIKGEERLLVPAAALERGAEHAYVYKVVDGKAVRVPVKLGRDDDERAEVVEGLAEGDEIIAELPAQPLDGKKVKLR